MNPFHQHNGSFPQKKCAILNRPIDQLSFLNKSHRNSGIIQDFHSPNETSSLKNVQGKDVLGSSARRNFDPSKMGLHSRPSPLRISCDEGAQTPACPIVTKNNPGLIPTQKGAY